MRMMMKVRVPAERGSAAIKDGTMGQIIGQTLERVKAEAAYFTAEAGERTGYIFFDLKDSTEMPSIAEPIFAGLGARIELTPVMNPEELRTGLGRIAGK